MKLYARGLFGTCFGLFALVNSVSAQTVAPAKEVELNFDALFEWKKPCSLNAEQLEAKLAALETVPGKKLYSLDKSPTFSQPSQLFNSTHKKACNLKYLVFANRAFEPESVRVMWANGQIDYIGIRYLAQVGESEAAPAWLASIGEALGSPSFSRNGTSYMWSGEHYSASASFMRSGEDTIFFVSVRPQRASSNPVVEKPSGSPSGETAPAGTVQRKIQIDLDTLVDWKNPLDLTLVAFESIMRQYETAPNERAYSSFKQVQPNGETIHSSRINLPMIQNQTVELTMLKGRFRPDILSVIWAEGRAKFVEVIFKRPPDQRNPPMEIVEAFNSLLGLEGKSLSAHQIHWTQERFFADYNFLPDDTFLRMDFYHRQAPTADIIVPPANPPDTKTNPMAPAAVLPAPGGTLKYTIDLDPLINWNDPLSIEPSEIATIFAHVIKETGRRLWTESESRTIMGWGNPDIKMTLMQGRLKIIHSNVYWGEPKNIFFRILQKEMAPGDEEWLYSKLDEILKVSRVDRKPQNNTFVSFEWVAKNFVVRTLKDQGETLTITISRPASFDPKQPAKPLAANLDYMLSFQSLWSTSADSLEKAFVVKTENAKNTNTVPQFEWVNVSKDRARFSRHMFSNVETNLTMFGGSIKLEEAILEFVNGKAARATISFYNRGDSGDIEVKEFDRIFKVIGQNLSQVMKVAPKRQMGSSNAALPVTGWNWTAPGGIALLEYNEYNTPGKVTKPEFLRLKLAAPNQADWSMGKMATGVQRMELLQRVKKTPDGDVYISGVPMVDQGQKGYCVAASCQRLFEYMRIPCDQHEMAKLVSIDAEGGADIATMQKSLAKIDGAFKVTFKPLVNPELYYSGNRKRRVSEKEFMSIIKDYTDKGVPLLWGLILGEKPEIPPLPNAGQTRGGHMRMVIGYNLAKNQVIFTDSWGAGHELKRMAMLDAYDVTMGLYSMAPRGL